MTINSGLNLSNPHQRRRFVPTPESDEAEPAGEVAPAPSYSPGDHRVSEVEEYAATLDSDGLRDLIATEEDGSRRSTLLAKLRAMLEASETGAGAPDEV